MRKPIFTAKSTGTKWCHPCFLKMTASQIPMKINTLFVDKSRISSATAVLLSKQLTHSVSKNSGRHKQINMMHIEYARSYWKKLYCLTPYILSCLWYNNQMILPSWATSTLKPKARFYSPMHHVTTKMLLFMGYLLESIS